MDVQQIKKMTKPDKKKLFGGLLLMLLAILLCFMGVAVSDSNTEAQSYYDLAINEDDQVGDVVYIDMVSGYQFATETDTYGNEFEYFYAFDDNEGLYIIRIDENIFNEINAVFEENPDDFIYKLTGRLQIVDDELKQLAAETLQEVFELDYYVEADEYDDYFLSTYLDVAGYNSEGDSSVVVFGILAIIIFCLGIVLFISYLKQLKKCKKVTEKPDYQDMLMQLNDHAYIYDNNNIIMTDNYLINTKGVLYGINYNDIILAYVHPVSVNKKLMFVLVACSSAGTDNFGLFSNKEDLTEVIELIKEHNPEIMDSYTKENIEKYNEIIHLKK